ncbi:MAG: glycerol-3-phosphate cytidylyltransferase [Marine Group III euryarchaeote CG-Epi4]|uniref:Glycerol-3-phosphate cytidylyltransferase n=1 Tax=Marine Group III euryarchaeote CG-Epi4 TaxID=1888998 RepID=A0A1J5TI06_9ARCH|nr:MAG: glycerol-3-phosphate cytidylyltransferase [Marine Group III euryarchaeote CG-Epi4]
MIIGYTTGVFDLFHIGHLNILRRAREKCDKLIVGVTTDELLKVYKNKSPIIPFEERISIVKSIRYVDEVVPQENMDKLSHWDNLKFNVVFVGDDWQNTDKWNKIESDFNKIGVKVIYFPYTKGTSSTLINDILVNERKKLRRSG